MWSHPVVPFWHLVLAPLDSFSFFASSSFSFFFQLSSHLNKKRGGDLKIAGVDYSCACMNSDQYRLSETSMASDWHKMLKNQAGFWVVYYPSTWRDPKSLFHITHKIPKLI